MSVLPSGLVVDASLAATWFLPDEATPYSEAALAATAATEVWVPALWVLEMGNLLLNAQRRKRITAAKRLDLVAAASGLNLRVDREAVPMTRMDALAAEHGLTTYDAAYLELAIRRSLPLATLDAALLHAMARVGIAQAQLAGHRDR